MSNTARYAGPTLAVEHDQDGTAFDYATASAGWDVSFGCKINLGPDPDGNLRVSVSVSDKAKHDGYASTAATPPDLRTLAEYLTLVADAAEAETHRNAIHARAAELHERVIDAHGEGR